MHIYTDTSHEHPNSLRFSCLGRAHMGFQKVEDKEPLDPIESQKLK